MKKPYIQPNSYVVVVNLLGSILKDVDMESASKGITSFNAREAQYDRFEDTNEDWDY